MTPGMVPRPTLKRRPNRPRIATRNGAKRNGAKRNGAKRNGAKRNGAKCNGARQASATAHGDMHRYSKARCYSKARRNSEAGCYKATDARIDDDIRNSDNGDTQNDGDRR